MKKTNNLNALKIAATFIGTVVGAGFASGQEILQFFNMFQKWGFLAVVLVSLLFMLFGYIIMMIGRNINSDSHNHIINQVSGKFLGGIFDLIITFFLFGALTAMAAGTGAMFEQQFHLPFLLGSGILTALTALTVLFGVKGVVNAISAVVPFLLGSVILIGLLTIFSGSFSDLGASLSTTSSVSASNTNSIIGNWFSSSILYVSYNTILSIGVLGMLGINAGSRKSMRTGAIFGGLGLGIGILAIFLATAKYLPEVSHVEIPMLIIAGKVGLPVQIGYSVVLIAEMYTTAVGSLYSFVSRMNVGIIRKTKERPEDAVIAKRKAGAFANTHTDAYANSKVKAGIYMEAGKELGVSQIDPKQAEPNASSLVRNRWTILLVSLSAFLASSLGFSTIVKYVYPVIGYAGLLLLVLFLFRWKKSNKA